METKQYDTSRFSTSEHGPGCHQDCEITCSCPDDKRNGDIWYHEYHDLASNLASCTKCTCVSGQTECGDILALYTVGSRECEEPQTSWTCYKDSNTFTTMSDDGTEETCSSDIGSWSKQWCKWTFIKAEEESGFDAGSWGCGVAHFLDLGWLECEAFADDQCIYVDTGYSHNNCYGETEIERLSKYFKCCDAATNGANCNDEDISISDSDCTRSKDYEDLWLALRKCMYESEFYEFIDECYDKGNQLSCDEFEGILNIFGECQCKFFAGIYGRVSNETQAALQMYIDGIYDSFSPSNKVLDCDVDLKCNLTELSETANDGAGKVYFIAVLWAISAYIAN